MKEKIKKLSKGIFEYEQPTIILSEEMIVCQLEEGKSYHGNFSIQNNSKTKIKGIVYSSSATMKILQSTFSGIENIIEYEISKESINQGEAVTGFIYIVSSCQEVELPFVINVELPFYQTSMGKIRDLFLFTNLSKTEPSEAAKLFQSEDFEQVFLRSDVKAAMIYRSLIKSTNEFHAMEEFLIAIHKKLPLSITVQKTSLEYQMRGDSFMDKLLLTKDQWGYGKFQVSADASFIQVEHEIILSDHFIGNSYYLEFVLEPSQMRDGVNFGRIQIESVYQSIVIDVKVDCHKSKIVKEESYSKKRECVSRLLQNYINFRTYKLESGYYTEESKAILTVLGSISSGRVVGLIRTHLNIVGGQKGLVKEQLDILDQEKEQMKQKSVLEYCAYLYLKALFVGDENTINIAVEEITNYYQNGYKQWQILWFLLYLDKRYESNKHLRLAAIKEHLQMGCHSPIMYYEACYIYNDEPALLKELDRESILVMNWAIKVDSISKELENQYIYLAARGKMFQPLIYLGLCKLYKQEASKDILFSICSMLIKGHMVGNKYFQWYRLGVEEQLRITELHEHYMYSLDETKEELLSQQILLYFVYNSTLSDKKKAYLYANIIRNKNSNPSIYNTYVKQMESFTYKQIAAHNISNSLAIIYEEFLVKGSIKEQLARELPYVLFQHEVICHNQKMTGVYVLHKELAEESYIPFVDGKAQISIFTENAGIFFVDSENNRYVETINYTINKFLNLEGLEQVCYEVSPDNKMVLLSLFDKIENYQKFDKNSIHIRKQVFELPYLSERYKKSSFTTLIKYYYENIEEYSLEELLINADVNLIDYNERSQIIEYCIIHHFYEKAVLYMKLFGYEKVTLKRLTKLCIKMISEVQEVQNDFLIELTHYVFAAGKYDEIILAYLVMYYQGTTKEMYKIWENAKRLELNTTDMEERLLGQMLFTESYMVHSEKVFLSYYVKYSNPMLTRAFLSYLAYKYLLNDRILEWDIFEIFKKEAACEENEVIMLALLKYYSEKQELTQEELNMVDYNMHKFIEKGVVFPFYQKFSDRIHLPHCITRQYYVEYKANPKNIVKIHYQGEQENGANEFVTEIMSNIYNGIHIKGFLLFYNEVMQYYITEEYDGEERITESFHVKMEQKIEEKCENKYGLINLMLMANEMKDEKTLLELMKQYVKTEYAEKQLFKPL